MLTLKWQAVQLGVVPVKEEMVKTVSRDKTQLSQNQQYVPPSVPYTGPVFPPSQLRRYVI